MRTSDVNVCAFECSVICSILNKHCQVGQTKEENARVTLHASVHTRHARVRRACTVKRRVAQLACRSSTPGPVIIMYMQVYK